MMPHSSEKIHTAMQDALAFLEREPSPDDALIRTFAEEVIRLSDETQRLTTALREIAIGSRTESALAIARRALTGVHNTGTEGDK